MAERKIEISVAGRAALLGARKALSQAQAFRGYWENGPAESLTDLAQEIRLHNMDFTLTKEERSEATYPIDLNWEEGNYLGLKERELNVLLRILDELASNIKHGIPDEPIFDEAKYYSCDEGYETEYDEKYTRWLNAYLRRAKELGHPEAMARFGIIFDDETEKGQVFVTQPIIPGETLKFNIEEATRARVLKKGKGRHFHGGGIFEINEGFFAERLHNEGLLHTSVQTIDELVNPQNPEAGSRRKVWIEFWRDPEYIWKPVLLE